MSNQTNYAHGNVWGDFNGSFTNNEKLIKSLMLIMVGNMVSIFTQVYIAKVTPIYSFVPHLPHTMPFLHLFYFFEPMWTFLWMFSFATVTGPVYSGASAFPFVDENPAINFCFSEFLLFGRWHNCLCSPLCH